MTANFQRSEFACRCGCGFDAISEQLVHNLQQLRSTIAKPIRILSGCRCAKHNRAVGGVKDSQHAKGTAADITVAGMPVAELHVAVERSGLFKGIGFYPSQNFVHVDVRQRSARWTG